jgi:hypothetical protein
MLEFTSYKYSRPEMEVHLSCRIFIVYLLFVDYKFAIIIIIIHYQLFAG